MARFIAVHELPAAATQHEVIEAGKAMANAPGKDTRWLRSWVMDHGDRLFSEWEAPHEAAIRQALQRASLFPVEAIYAVTVLDPAWFRQ